MLTAFLNTLKVKELRNRLLFTALIIVLVRFASNIPCPGVDPAALEKFITEVTANSSGGFMALIDLFSGGALAHFALGALGIMPYITASIIIQLLVPVLPQLEKMQREGETGRQKISQYTRYLTIIVCLVQGAMVAVAMVNPSKLGLPNPSEPLFVGSKAVFIPITVLVITCTTMVFTWLGEQITERGIGNGVSLIITINIVSRLPHSVIELIDMAIKGQTPDGGTFRPVQLLLYHLGRWIYLIDARDDFQRDQQTKSYNPLLFRFGPDGDDAVLANTLEQSLNMMRSAFCMLNFGCRTAVIENILYLGLPLVQRAVFDGSWEQIKKQKIWRTNQ